MATTRKPFELGTVSEGTLRTEDLLEAFADALERLAGTSDLVKDAHDLLMANADWDWDDLGEAQQIVSDLEDALQEYCPPFVYFGAHPGDGADFGFWPDHDALQDALRYARSTDAVWGNDFPMVNDELLLEDDGVIVHVSDHGNVTVYDMERNELWSCV